MTGRDLQKSFETRLWTIIPETEFEAKLDSDTIFYWINESAIKFAKDRFNGYNPTKTSYEQNEKRTRDLVNLYEEKVSLTPIEEETTETYDYKQYKYPEDLMFVLNEDVCISDNNDKHVLYTSVFECTADNFMYRINNSLTDFHYRYHKARPLRIRTQNGFRLLTDKNYKIHSYKLGYLRKPQKVDTNYDDKDCVDFQDYIWTEIVEQAVQMYITYLTALRSTKSNEKPSKDE